MIPAKKDVSCHQDQIASAVSGIATVAVVTGLIVVIQTRQVRDWAAVDWGEGQLRHHGLPLAGRARSEGWVNVGVECESLVHSQFPFG